MDGERFDDLIRRICTTRLTRLGAIRGMVAGTAAALTATSLAGDEASARKKRGKGKRRGTKGRGGRFSAQSVETCLTCATPVKTGPTPGNNDRCGFRFDVPADPSYPIEGTYEHKDGDCSCTIGWTISKDGDASELAFGPVDGKPVCTVFQVIVKGGNGYFTYAFEDGALCASGLISPDNASGGPADISHFDFCTDAVDCCTPLTCAAVGCTDGPICDGCGGRIECPCPDDCSVDGLGPNTECDAKQGICVCTKDTCADVSVECGTGFDNGCCGTFDCNCPTNCPEETDDGPNNRCDDGTCVCAKNTCDDLPSGVECGKNFDDGCCGEFNCPCPTECKDGNDGPNNTCTDAGICVCTPDTCESEGLKCTNDALNDGCCGTFGCPCPTSCPGGGANNRCTDDGCVCTKNTCQSLGVSCGIHDDGCCGEIDCGPCPEECSSCTIGYYSQNQCRVDTSVKLPCGADSAIGKTCFKKYGTTLKGLLTARGGDVICAQAAAAYLNQTGFGKESCTDGIDICKADNATLSAANEEGECPLQGCGKPDGGKPDNKKKKKR